MSSIDRACALGDEGLREPFDLRAKGRVVVVGVVARLFWCICPRRASSVVTIAMPMSAPMLRERLTMPYNRVRLLGW